MHILICNDDGVHAKGIKALQEELANVARITVVAPLEERSTTGHTLTLDHPLRVVQIENGVYGCSGFPADCAQIGFGHILKNDPPDLVVSGINRGANMAQDTYYSGTVAAAREATFYGIPSVSISLAMDFLGPDHLDNYYGTASRFMRKMVEHDIHKKIEPYTLINVNIPDVPWDQVKGAKVTKLGLRKYSNNIIERNDFRDRKYYWIAGGYEGFKSIEGSDCNAVDEENISLTSINLLQQTSDIDVKWQKFLDEIMK